MTGNTFFRMQLKMISNAAVTYEIVDLKEIDYDDILSTDVVEQIHVLIGEN